MTYPRKLSIKMIFSNLFALSFASKPFLKMYSHFLFFISTFVCLCFTIFKELPFAFFYQFYYSLF